ncbi:32729_t:CDS:2 [Gigaspora margarita]|uniref:32729_t:CDS:1 n=1 Tax=Gigaspora margarita TaxID=4874 RepID=A0ABN7UCW3_GIGMA|nr:32729_t:CDS:2 [Gigaspora margarita]
MDAVFIRNYEDFVNKKLIPSKSVHDVLILRRGLKDTENKAKLIQKIKLKKK